jgi:hypothetical protein
VRFWTGGEGGDNPVSAIQHPSDFHRRPSQLTPRLTTEIIAYVPPVNELIRRSNDKGA